MTWFVVETYTPSGGPVSASNAPGSIGGGWVDINGNSWSIDSSNNLNQIAAGTNAYAQNELIRTGISDNLVDSQISVKYTPNGGPNLELIARAKTVSAGSLTSYLVVVNASGTFSFFTCSGVSVTSIGSTSSGTALTTGTQYIATFSVVQTNSTTTTLTATVSTVPGTVVNTATITDTTSSLQNSTGGQGLAFNSITGGAGSVQQITTYTDIGPADATMLANDAACVLSPNNWEQGSSGITSVQSSWAGAYARFYIKGCTSVSILVDGANTNGSINWQIDSGSLLNTVQIPSNGVIAGITIPDTGSHAFKVFVSTYPAGLAGRWNSTGYVGLKGLGLYGTSASSDPNKVVTGTNSAIIYGDSTTEGIRALTNSPEVDGNQYEYSFLLGQALRTQGFEYSIVGCSSQGYTIAGTGGVPAFFTIGNDSSSSWNKISSATSRLDGNGKFKKNPSVIIDVHGANDGLQSVSSSTITSVVQALYAAMRLAAPSATIIGVIPFGGYVRTAKLAGINNYIAASGDANVKIVDLAIDSRFSNTTFSGDGIHLQPIASGEIVALLIPAVFSAMGMLNVVSTGKYKQVSNPITSASMVAALQSSSAVTGTSNAALCTISGLRYTSKKDTRTTTTATVAKPKETQLVEVIVNDVSTNVV